MLKKIKYQASLLFFLLFSYSNVITAQSCLCSDNLEWLIRTFSENDAGYDYVLDKKGLDEFNNHNEQYRLKSRKVDEITDCLELLRNWTSFFR